MKKNSLDMRKLRKAQRLFLTLAYVSTIVRIQNSTYKLK